LLCDAVASSQSVNHLTALDHREQPLLLTAPEHPVESPVFDRQARLDWSLLMAGRRNLHLPLFVTTSNYWMQPELMFVPAAQMT